MDKKFQPQGSDPAVAQPPKAGAYRISSTRQKSPRHCLLPNRMEIAYQARAEVDFFYKDIFEKEIYLKHGINLADEDCIFDVGANIGLFTLFAHQKCRNVRIYAFEPAPPLFEILRLNTSRYGVNVKLFNCGLSNENKTAAFTFYPNSSGMSSFYADRQEEKEALWAIMENQLHQGMAGMERVMRYADELLEERLKSETYDCCLKTVSEVIDEEQISFIDLLKVDVQKSELDIVAGIKEADWPKIKQLVIEVHDIDGRLQQVRSLLQAQGYEVAVEQDEHYHHSILYNLFARRKDRMPAPPRVEGNQLSPAALQQFQERARKQEEALHRRKHLLEQRKKS